MREGLGWMREVFQDIQHHDQAIRCRRLKRRIERTTEDRAATPRVIAHARGRRFDAFNRRRELREAIEEEAIAAADVQVAGPATRRGERAEDVDDRAPSRPPPTVRLVQTTVRTTVLRIHA